MKLHAHLLIVVLALRAYVDPAFIRQALLAKEQDKPCSSAAARQFDFWLGEWEVTAKGKLAGSNKISRAAGDCAVLEEYHGQSGYSGKSLNFFNPELDKWQQVWVGSAGDILVLTGEYGDGKMILAGESTQSGKKVQNRITWFNNTAEGTVRQLWESSEDAGNSWNVVFDGLYTKKK
ncbi:MAG: hypothetical protein ACREOO_19160 [bacterium]